MAENVAAHASHTSLCRLSVAEVMQRQVYSVHKEAPLIHAARVMGEHNIRHVVVTDTFGRPVGVFSERDMLRHIAASAARGEIVPGRTPVKEVMTESPITVSPTTPLTEVARLLSAHKIGCVPVVDRDGTLVGIVSVIDVLRTVAELGDGDRSDV